MTVAASSVGREVAFVTSHTVHHNAILGQLLCAHGVHVPLRFGIAPSTPCPDDVTVQQAPAQETQCAL
jgi:hypothetical protein